MINGEIHRGTTGSAGEVSIHNPKEDDNFSCSFGDPCFLKRREADLEIVHWAKKMLSSGTNSSRILELAEGDTNKITLRMVFDAANEGDQLAVDLVRQAGERLGIKVAFLVNFLNPEMVIIGGGIEEAGPILLDAVRKTVDEWAFEEMAKAVKIVPSRLGEKSVALGAASMVIRNIFVAPF
jgi:predicted NBD/HSP70 family sugar kinase